MYKFTSYKNWLMEEEKLQSKKLDYGCVMLYAKVPDWEERISYIKKEDIYDDELNDYGLEDTPHCTLLFGIHLNETDPFDVKQVMTTFMPVKSLITYMSTFNNPIYDVVKYDVPVNYQLRKYHEILKKTFPNTQDFPDYHPHMTIAYVLPGTGKKYTQTVKAFQVVFNKAVYSYKNEGGILEKINVEL